MPRKAQQLDVHVELRSLPMPPEHAAVRRAALLWLAEWILEDLALHPEEYVDEDGQAVFALFTVEVVSE